MLNSVSQISVLICVVIAYRISARTNKSIFRVIFRADEKAFLVLTTQNEKILLVLVVVVFFAAAYLDSHTMY